MTPRRQDSRDNVEALHWRWRCTCGVFGEWTTGRWHRNWVLHAEKNHPGLHEGSRDSARMTPLEARVRRALVRSDRSRASANKRGVNKPVTRLLRAGQPVRLWAGTRGVLTLRGLPPGSLVVVDGAQRRVPIGQQVRCVEWRDRMVEVRLIRLGWMGVTEAEGVGTAAP